MNNYLANIAARSFNLTPLVRPRLPGQFEAPVQSDGAINRPEFGRAPTSAAQPEAPEIESSASVDTAPPAPHRRARGSFDVKDEPIHAAPSSRDNRAMHRSVRVEARPIEPSVNAVTETRTPRGASPVRRGQAEAQSPDEASTSTSLERRRASEQQHISADDGQRTATIQPASSSSGEEVNKSRPPVAPRQAGMATVAPRPAGVREKSGIDDSAETNDKSPRLPSITPIAPLSRVDEQSGPSNRLPVIVQSRVAPRLAGDRFALNQQANVSPEPTVQVTIGRIEVRAVQSSQPSSAKPRATPPVMNLDDYLRRRSSGGAR